MHTDDWANQRRALGSRVQALPGDAQLLKAGGQAVKACVAASSRRSSLCSICALSNCTNLRYICYLR